MSVRAWTSSCVFFAVLAAFAFSLIAFGFVGWPAVLIAVAGGTLAAGLGFACEFVCDVVAAFKAHDEIVDEGDWFHNPALDKWRDEVEGGGR